MNAYIAGGGSGVGRAAFAKRLFMVSFSTCWRVLPASLRRASATAGTRALSSISVPQESSGAPLRDIALNSSERKLFGLLCAVVRHYKLGTTVRVAGGWVRNKLLGIPAGDIDIALDNMTGVEYAHHLNRYMVNERGSRERKVAVVRANPAQSKHLETATMRLFGQDIDFVHLRSEQYSEGSRIPSTIAFGTPLTDATRRDFTMNALFYRLPTEQGEVEDFTGSGLSDLAEGCLRTPLAPAQTLRDDPLRALRGVRFAATFSFSMADELNAALRGDGGLNVALEVRNKVSQERVAIEARKMLALHGARPLHALSLLHEYGLRDCVFGLTWTEEQWHAALSGAQRVLHAHTRGDQRQACAQHVALLAHLLLASLPLLVHAEEVAHLRGLAQAMSQDEDDVERTFKFAANMILMFEAIQMRLKKALRQCVNARILNQSEAKQVSELVCAALLLPALQMDDGDSAGCMQNLFSHASHRVKFGLWLRFAGDNWEDAFAISTATTKKLSHPADFSSSPLHEALLHSPQLHRKSQRPLLNGKQLMELGNIPQGSAVGRAVKALYTWQLCNPGASEQDAASFCRDHLQTAMAFYENENKN